MCILILQKPKSKKLSYDSLHTYAKRNPDGFGLMYVHKNKLCIDHTMSVDSFIRMYDDVHDNLSDTSPIVLHFRLGTGGYKNTDNCHPFRVNENIGMAHNGIFNCVNSTVKYSDTYIFNEEYCKPLGDDLFKSHSTRVLLQDTIGGSNKVVFLNNQKSYLIFNEKLGEWKDDIWYSFKVTPVTSNNNYLSYNTCEICKVSYPKREIYSITEPGSYLAKHVCVNCVTQDTRISDVVEVSDTLCDNIYNDGYLT